MNKFSEIYEHDFNAWVESQVLLLKQGKTSEIDIEHLVEELEEMSRNNLRELESRFIILLAHLLKWQFQLALLVTQWKELEGKSWRNTIIEQRTQLLFLLRKVPSLKSSLQDSVAEAYPEAVKLATKETNLPSSTFPAQCSYTVEQILDDDFFPERI